MERVDRPPKAPTADPASTDAGNLKARASTPDKAVVVVFPCTPQMALEFLDEEKAPSASGYVMTGIDSACALRSSGWESGL